MRKIFFQLPDVRKFGSVVMEKADEYVKADESNAAEKDKK